MPMPKAGNAASRSDACWAVPVEPRVPMALKLHDLRSALSRMAAQIGQHGDPLVSSPPRHRPTGLARLGVIGAGG